MQIVQFACKLYNLHDISNPISREHIHLPSAKLAKLKVCANIKVRFGDNLHEVLSPIFKEISYLLCDK